MLFAAEVRTGSHILNAFIILMGLVIIFTILIQRGKGGGLIGAFGGAGGSSPFGAKGGDKIMKATIIFAGIWVALIIFQVRVAKWDLASNRAAEPNQKNVDQ